ncbi:hypothetical protein [Cerasicoccus frondis]|uniref:hypothetical protein n=1 Tax=Cerasicoccus frondis TaxID=490090 RepID=UPI0028528642|nr:hypothetical protein [Cerasicoccus frondis]
MFCLFARNRFLPGILCAAGLWLGAIGGAVAEETPKVLAAVKFPPLKTLSDELMGLARKLAPGQQTEFYPMMVLGPFGYPSYPGVSQSDNITIFFFEPQKGELTTPYVILTKMEPDALVKKTLTMKAEGNNSMFAFLTPGLEVAERGGWTLFSDEAAYFDYASDIDALVDMADDIEGFDITMRVYMGPETVASWSEIMKEEIADAHVLAGGAESDPGLLHKQLLVDFLATVGSNLEWFESGLDLDAEAVSLGFSVQAIKGTPEYDALSMPVGGPVPVGEYINASAVSFLSKWDMAAVVDYYGVLEQRAMQIATEEGREMIKKASEYNRKLLAQMSGGHAGSMSFEQEKPLSSSALGGAFDAAMLDASLHFYYDELFPYLLETFAPQGQQGVVEMVYRSQVAETSGAPVSEIETKTPDLPIGLTQGEASEATEDSAEKMFVTVIKGNVLGSSDLQDLESLAARVSDETPLEDSVAQRLALENGQAARLQIDVCEVVNMLSEDYEPESEVARQAIKKLGKSDLEPLTGVMTIAEGQGVYLFSAPVSTLVEFSDTHRQIRQAEKDMDAHGGKQMVFPAGEE